MTDRQYGIPNGYVKGPIRLGDYELFAVSAGRFWLDGGTMFGVVPKSLWSKRVETDPENRIPQELACLLVRGRDKTWLIETGIGNKLPDKMRAIYKQEEPDALLESLRRIGVAADEIDGVILTHLHQDHVGGATRHVNGETRLTFPNAKVFVQQAEWDEAVGSDGQTAAGYRVEENIEPLDRAGVVELLNGASDIAPGIRVEPSPGHTRGHQSVLIEGGGKTACFIGDLVPSRHHLRPIYIMAYDLYPRETYLNKQAFLDRAVEEDWLLTFTHDEGPWGGVRRDDRGGYAFIEEGA